MKRRKAFPVFSSAFFLAALPSLTGCTEPAPASSWVSAGMLVQARSGHSATRLDDGAVLFAGGESASGRLSSAELYDAPAKQWSSPQTNGAQRARHAAVKLHDGRVMLIGGTNKAASPCVESFDPNRREFTADNSWMGDCPAQPTATWVPLSKEIVVVGGSVPNGALKSVAAYDSVTNTWSGMPDDMSVARVEHTATVIEDEDGPMNRTILVVAGGTDLQQTQAGVELHDMTTGAWKTVDPMTDPRRDHTATLLGDGTILGVGTILVLGGQNDGSVLSSAERAECDPSTNTCTWSPAGSLHHARHGHTATLLNDGNVLVAGGTDASGKPLDSVEVYDVAQRAFVEMEPMSTARTGHTATWLSDGSVLVAGGTDATSGFLATAERFVPEDAHIPCQRTQHCPRAMVCNAERYCEQSEFPLTSKPACTYAGAPGPAAAGTVTGLFALLLGAWGMRRRRTSKRGAAALVAGATLLVPSLSHAQTPTFYLDRLQIAGGSEDGTGVWRPVFGRTGLFGQVAFGYARDPLRVATFVQDANQAQALSGSAVSLQVTGYATVGVELVKRGAIQVSLPYVAHQRGYATDDRTAGLDQVVTMAPSALGDLRIDGRMLVLWNESRSFSMAARVAAFLPTGDEFSFMGEGHAWGHVGLSAEYTTEVFFLTANAGVTMRPKSTLVDLTVGSEFVVAVGAYVPLNHDRVRFGAEFWGNLGLSSSIGPAAIPVEAALSGRMAWGAERRVFLGLSTGWRVGVGYAPDMRLVARIGGVIPFEAVTPEPKLPVRVVPEADTDGDGFVDADDKCPLVREDFKREKDGCPEADEDKDGIDTSVDACPAVPEDKDGIDDTDGCPEEDADGDGFADVEDKCPKEPGVRNEDPAKLGCPQFIERTKTQVKLVKEIGFDFYQATITRESYPILDEIAKLLQANPDIKQLRIEGHTDNVGDAAFNQRLSLQRAEAVRNYLVQRGKVNPARLSFQGFGATRPIAPNNTEAGRAKNRRVELHIGEAEGGEEKKP